MVFTDVGLDQTRGQRRLKTDLYPSGGEKYDFTGMILLCLLDVI